MEAAYDYIPSPPPKKGWGTRCRQFNYLVFIKASNNYLLKQFPYNPQYVPKFSYLQYEVFWLDYRKNPIKQLREPIPYLCQLWEWHRASISMIFTRCRESEFGIFISNICILAYLWYDILDWSGIVLDPEGTLPFSRWSDPDDPALFSFVIWEICSWRWRFLRLRYIFLKL